jgi:hypothetical protein
MEVLPHATAMRELIRLLRSMARVMGRTDISPKEQPTERLQLREQL